MNAFEVAAIVAVVFVVGGVMTRDPDFDAGRGSGSGSGSGRGRNRGVGEEGGGGVVRGRSLLLLLLLHEFMNESHSCVRAIAIGACVCAALAFNE